MLLKSTQRLCSFALRSQVAVRTYSTSQKKTLYICKTGHEDELISDLRSQTDKKIRCNKNPNWVEMTGHLVLDSPWCYQSIPDVEIFTLDSSDSPTKLAQMAAGPTAKKLKEATLWDIHSHPTPGTSFQSKVKQVESSLLDTLKRSHKAVYGRRLRDKTKILEPGHFLVQMMMTDSKKVAISVAQLSANESGWNRPTPWPGGYHYFYHDKKYPAESFLKMKEMLSFMRFDKPGAMVGKTCIELGAAPGGWTMVMLENGARVWSVDWAPLDDPFFKDNPNHLHIRGDAKMFDPTHVAEETKGQPKALNLPVDFLFADLAMPPIISAATLEIWIEKRWMRRFGWAIKFGFHDDTRNFHLVTKQIREMLDKHGVIYSIRHLHNQGNEYAVMGYLPGV